MDGWMECCCLALFGVGSEQMRDEHMSEHMSVQSFANTRRRQHHEWIDK